jgi:hypothetical protein
MRFRYAWIVLVPALALAAPRGHHHGPRHSPHPPPPPPPAAGSDAGSAAAAGSAATPAASPAAGSAATPAAPTAPATDTDAAAGSAAASATPDVDALRQQYLALRDELFQSRARANAVASQLYSTRVTIRFTWTSGRYYGVTKSSVRLDGATVYQDAGGAIANDDGVRFDGFIAPGRHLVTFHVEAAGKDDDSFTSSTETQVVVKAIANQDLLVAARAHDGGDIAYEWKRSSKGSYGLGVDVDVHAMPRADAGGKGKK